MLIARAAFGATEVLLGKPIPYTSLDRHSLFSSSSASVSGIKLRTDALWIDFLYSVNDTDLILFFCSWLSSTMCWAGSFHCMIWYYLKKNVSVALSVCFWVPSSVPRVGLWAFVPVLDWVCCCSSVIFPIKSATSQGCLLPVLLFNRVLRVLARKIKQETDREDIKTRIQNTPIYRWHDSVLKIMFIL